MHRAPAFFLLTALALLLPASSGAKGFTRAVLVSRDGSSIEVRSSESRIDGLWADRRAAAPARGGYLRLFFVGPGEFPANPARFYPDVPRVALDLPAYEVSCRRIDAAVVHLLRGARTFPRFHRRPTLLERVIYGGPFPAAPAFEATLKAPLELALDRRGRVAPQPRGCYRLSGRWRGPAVKLRPRRFLLCPTGVYVAGRLHPLGRGVWAFFRLNSGLALVPQESGQPGRSRSGARSSSVSAVLASSGLSSSACRRCSSAAPVRPASASAHARL